MGPRLADLEVPAELGGILHSVDHDCEDGASVYDLGTDAYSDAVDLGFALEVLVDLDVRETDVA